MGSREMRSRRVIHRLAQKIEGMEFEPRIDVALMTGETVNCVNVKPRIFNTYLIDKLGMTFKRACLTGIAIEHLHDECCALDCRNRDRIMDMKVCEILDLYGRQEEMYSSFQELWESNQND